VIAASLKAEQGMPEEIPRLHFGDHVIAASLKVAADEPDVIGTTGISAIT